MIENLLDDALANQAHTPMDDDRLINTLGTMGDPQEVAEALRVLLQAPASFWNAERIEGTLSVLCPTAIDIVDDEEAIAMWTLMASLLAHHNADTGQNAAQTYHESLGSLLESRHADIRGFAATSLSQARADEATAALLEALATETRWDVAMRITGALVMTTEPAPIKLLTPLLSAPTEEAQAYVHQEIRRRGLQELRTDLLQHPSAHTDTTLHALNRAQALNTLRPQVSKAQDGASHNITLSKHQSRASTLLANVRLAPQSATLHVRCRLPGDDQTTHQRHYTQLATALAQLVAANPKDTQHTVNNQDGMVLDLTLADEPPLVLIGLLTPIINHLHQTLQTFERPSARRPEKVNTALQALLAKHITPLSKRQQTLQSAFAGLQTLQDPNGGLQNILAHGASAQGQTTHVSFALTQDRGQLTGSTPGLSLNISLWDDKGDQTHGVVERLTAILRWKLGLDLTVSQADTTQTGLLKLLGLPTGPHTSTLTTDNPNHTSNKNFSWHLERWSQLAHFLHTLTQASTFGAHPLEMLGLLPPTHTWKPAPLSDAPRSPQAKRAQKLEAFKTKVSTAQTPTQPAAKAQKTTQTPAVAPTQTPTTPSRVTTSKPTAPSAKNTTQPDTQERTRIIQAPKPTGAAPQPVTREFFPKKKKAAAAPTAPQNPQKLQEAAPATQPLKATSSTLPSTSATGTPAKPPQRPKPSKATDKAAPQPQAKETPPNPTARPKGKQGIEWPPRSAMAKLGAPDKDGPPSMPSLPSASAKDAPSPPQTAARAPQRPADSGRQPLDAKGRTPTEVVKNLNANIAHVDVYLRSAGYSTGKLAQIMSILMGMDMGDARKLIEKAPCLLAENIPRDRSRTIKTVLEGTGAKLAITPHGETL